MYHSKNGTCICVLHILFKKKDCSSLVSTCLHHEFNSVHLFTQMNTGNYWSYKQSMLSVSMSWRRLVTCLSYNTRSIRTTSKRLAKLFFKPDLCRCILYTDQYIYENWITYLMITKSFDLYIGSLPSVCYLMIIFV